MGDFLVAIGLVFVIEGLLFAAAPEYARRAMLQVAATPESALRIVGIVSAVLGLILVWAIRG